MNNIFKYIEIDLEDFDKLAIFAINDDIVYSSKQDSMYLFPVEAIAKTFQLAKNTSGALKQELYIARIDDDLLSLLEMETEEIQEMFYGIERFLECADLIEEQLQNIDFERTLFVQEKFYKESIDDIFDPQYNQGILLDEAKLCDLLDAMNDQDDLIISINFHIDQIERQLQERGYSVCQENVDKIINQLYVLFGNPQNFVEVNYDLIFKWEDSLIK